MEKKKRSVLALFGLCTLWLSTPLWILWAIAAAIGMGIALIGGPLELWGLATPEWKTTAACLVAASWPIFWLLGLVLAYKVNGAWGLLPASTATLTVILALNADPMAKTREIAIQAMEDHRVETAEHLEIERLTKIYDKAKLQGKASLDLQRTQMLRLVQIQLNQGDLPAAKEITDSLIESSPGFVEILEFAATKLDSTPAKKLLGETDPPVKTPNLSEIKESQFTLLPLDAAAEENLEEILDLVKAETKSTWEAGSESEPMLPLPDRGGPLARLITKENASHRRSDAFNQIRNLKAQEELQQRLLKENEERDARPLIKKLENNWATHQRSGTPVWITSFPLHIGGEHPIAFIHGERGSLISLWRLSAKNQHKRILQAILQKAGIHAQDINCYSSSGYGEDELSSKKGISTESLKALEQTIVQRDLEDQKAKWARQVLQQWETVTGQGTNIQGIQTYGSNSKELWERNSLGDHQINPTQLITWSEKLGEGSREASARKTKQGWQVRITNGKVTWELELAVAEKTTIERITVGPKGLFNNITQ